MSTHFNVMRSFPVAGPEPDAGPLSDTTGPGPMLLFNPAKLGPVDSEACQQHTPSSPPPAASIEAFLQDIEGRAFRFAELGLRHREDALDAVQDAMLKMLTYRSHAPSEWPALFWSILRNRMTDMQRRSLLRLRWLLPGSSHPDGELIDWADEISPDPSRSNDSREAWARISQALRSLPARQREAFTLRILEELDVAETARVMGCSEGSVKTHLSRARDALQKQLEEFR